MVLQHNMMIEASIGKQFKRDERKRYILLEIIENDSIRNDLTEARYSI